MQDRLTSFIPGTWGDPIHGAHVPPGLFSARDLGTGGYPQYNCSLAQAVEATQKGRLVIFFGRFVLFLELVGFSK